VRKGGVYDLRPLFDFHFPEEMLEAPPRLRKRHEHRIRNFSRRDTKYILSREFPGVAMWDPETDEIIILTDIWMGSCWKKWIRNFDKFIAYLVHDLIVSHIHELIHWATEPLHYIGKELTDWEDKVEDVAINLTLDRLENCPYLTAINLEGDEKENE
jgi:hypothetical protein